MKTEHSFDVFLSYNNLDRATVEAIARMLEDEEGLRTWFDQWRLIPGVPWQEAIEQGLSSSRTCVVFLGTGGIGPWENEEMRAALQMRVEHKEFRVIPVLLPGARLPHPGVLPPFLARWTWINFQSGLDNEVEFRRLVAGIRGLMPGRHGDATSTPLEIECPYRGLEVFEEAHAGFFFGREALSQHVIEALLHQRIVAIIGSSGCGKSSLVRAGVIPQLKSGKLTHSDTWIYITLRPASHPLSELAVSLVAVDPNSNPIEHAPALLSRLKSDEWALHFYIRLLLSEKPKHTLCLLFIDQFEEIMTLCCDEQERQQFLLNLRYAATNSEGRVVTVLTMRADFMERAAAERNLAEMLSGHHLVVSPMDDTDLRRAIEEPAMLVGLRFEKGLVELILEEVGHEPGALPLLEDALTQLYEHRSPKNFASLQTYQEIGGVHGALAKRAEKVFEVFSSEEKDIARRVFLRLTQPGEGTADTRRRAELSELWPDSAHQAVVEKVVERLIESRLLTMSSDPRGARMVDVAHEALIRGWPRLRGWIEEEREPLRIHRGITEATRDWQARNRDAELLYRGVRLAEANELRRKSYISLNKPEREFLETSDAAQRREKRAARTRRWAAVIAVSFTLSLSVFTIKAWREQRAAQQEQQAASLRELTSRVRQFKNTDPELSLRLAIEAAHRSSTAQVESALRQALNGFPESMALDGHDGIVWSIDYSKNGKNRIVTAGADATARIWDAESGKQLRLLPGHVGEINRAIFSPDGKKVVTIGADATARIWNDEDTEDAAAQKPLVLLGHKGEVLGVDFNRNGEKLVTVGEDQTVRLWNVESGAQLYERRVHAGAVNRVAFNPVGNTFVTVSDDKTARIWDAESGKVLHVLKGHTNAIIRVAYSQRGEFIATASKDKTVMIWNARTGSYIQMLKGHGGIVNSVNFSPDGTKVVTASDDTSARLWDVQTGRTLPVLLGHSGFIYRAEFSPDGNLIVTASADKTVRLWKAKTGQTLSVLQGHDAEKLYATFSPKGDYIAAVGSGTGWVWKVSTNQPRLPIAEHGDEIWSVAYSPDGKYVATGSGNEGSRDNTARIWVVETGKEFRKFGGYEERIQSVAFSPDGKYLATACFDHKARIFDIQKDELLVELDGGGGSVWAVAFSPDGRKVITGHRDKSVQLWDARTGEHLKKFYLHQDIVRSVAFSPDGKYVVSASKDGTARVWEPETGKEVSALNGRGRLMFSVAFSPDGRYVVTASTDRTTRIWEAQTGKELQVLRGHTGTVTSAAFSPNGNYVVTSSRDRTVRLWDRHTGEQFSLLHGHNDIVRSAAFSPDGRYVVTAGTDKIVRIYTCEECAPLAELLKIAVSRNPRQLRPEELKNYQIER